MGERERESMDVRNERLEFGNGERDREGGVATTEVGGRE